MSPLDSISPIIRKILPKVSGKGIRAKKIVSFFFVKPQNTTIGRYAEVPCQIRRKKGNGADLDYFIQGSFWKDSIDRVGKYNSVLICGHQFNIYAPSGVSSDDSVADKTDPMQKALPRGDPF